MNTGSPNFLFDLEIGPLTLSQGQGKIHNKNSCNMLYHNTKFVVDGSNGFQIIWN